MPSIVSEDFPAKARNRLAVLSAHLTGASIDDDPNLEPNCVSAQNPVPSPGNLKGSLTVIDDRTGKSYRIQVSQEGTVKATDLKKVPFLFHLILFPLSIHRPFRCS